MPGPAWVLLSQICILFSRSLYRDETNSLQIQLSRTQAGPGRAVKEQQEQNSPNHVLRINLISVHQQDSALSRQNSRFCLLSVFCCTPMQDKSTNTNLSCYLLHKECTMKTWLQDPASWLYLAAGTSSQNF